MNNRTKIILFTAFSIIIGPLIILGFILKLAGRMLDILGWLCWMEPRMARKGWNELNQKNKRIMEHKLGETFIWHGHTLEVAEVEDPEMLAADAGFLSRP